MTVTPSTSQRTEISGDGKFVRQLYVFTGRFSADGSSGFKAEPGRYHLYVSLACPWAHRTLIMRALKGTSGRLGSLPGLTLNEAKGRPSAEAEAILRQGAPLPLA